MQTVRHVHAVSYISIGLRVKESSAVLHNGKLWIKQVHQGLLHMMQKYHHKESCFSAGLARLRLFSSALDCGFKLVHR